MIRRQLLARVAVVLLLSFEVHGAESLPQDYVVVHLVRDLKDPARAVFVGTPDILQLPATNRTPPGGDRRLDRWTTASDWGQMAGRKVHLRIRLRNADLYAFWTGKEDA